MRLIKVAIVEDNALVIRSLVETIDWAGLGCEICGTATDGLSGEQLILDRQPDILLTDIRMPNRDGLAMIEAVREKLPAMKVIIITGYDHFQYASKAIKLAVFDYILKPIRNEELIAAVRKAMGQMQVSEKQEAIIAQADRTQARAQLLSLLTNVSHVGQSVHTMLEQSGLVSKAYYVIILQPMDAGALPMETLDSLDERLSASGAKALSVVLYDSVVVYAMRDSADGDWQREAAALCGELSGILPVNVHIGISRLNTSIHQIRSTYQQARQALWESAMNSTPGACAFYHEIVREEDSHLSAMRVRIDELIDKSDLSDAAAREAAAALVALSGQQYSQLRALVSLYAMLLIRKFPVTHGGAVEKALSASWFVTGEKDVASCLTAVSATLRQAQEQEKARCSLLTSNVLEYIRLHGAEKLGLNEVADKFFVSSTYLSALIRRETGTTFHEHVLNAKMEIARGMLADPRILVEEVASAIGYSNYVSFYNTFKRLEHMTPTEYRKSLAQK